MAVKWVACGKFGDRRCREGGACTNAKCGFAHPADWICLQAKPPPEVGYTGKVSRMKMMDTAEANTMLSAVAKQEVPWIATGKFRERRCREGGACTNPKCGFAHPADWVHYAKAPTPPVVIPWIACGKFGDRKCRDGGACRNAQCGFAHPHDWVHFHGEHLQQGAPASGSNVPQEGSSNNTTVVNPYVGDCGNIPPTDVTDEELAWLDQQMAMQMGSMSMGGGMHGMSMEEEMEMMGMMLPGEGMQQPQEGEDYGDEYEQFLAETSAQHAPVRVRGGSPQGGPIGPPSFINTSFTTRSAYDEWLKAGADPSALPAGAGTPPQAPPPPPPSSPLPSSVSAVHFTTVGQILSDVDSGALATRLASHGIDSPSARANSFGYAAKRLLNASVDPSTRCTAFWVPGRVEVMGKHTDYCGGRSLLCAVSKGFAVVSADRTDSSLRVLATFELSGGEDEATVPLDGEAGEELPDGWSRYPAACARRLSRNFGITLGVDLALSCDLPEASGMSSSSAVVILTFLSLAARNHLISEAKFVSSFPSPEELCHYLGCIENGQDCGPGLPGDNGVGTFGGSEDHTAIMLCEPNQLRQYSFCPTALEAVIPFPSSEWVMLIAVSGATAQKGAERLKDYNDAAMLARHAAQAANNDTPATLASVVRRVASDLSVSPFDKKVREAIKTSIAAKDDGTYKDDAPKGSLVRRFEQFFEESEVLVPKVGTAFNTTDGPALGLLVCRSQELTETHLRNTLEETEWLPAEARRLGCLAASAFGAGFGGSVWAIAGVKEAGTLLKRWEEAYAKAYPDRSEQARFFAMASPGPGARSVG